MFGYSLKKTADLEAMSTKLANAQAQAEAANKKTKAAIIAGSSTTGATVAAIAAHFIFGNGRKLNRDKIKNYDSVIEERDRAIEEKNSAKKDLDNRTIERDAAMASGHKMVIAAETGDGAALNAAIEEHKTYSGWLYGKEGNSPEKVKERIDMFNAMLDEMRKADQTATTNTATTTPATTTNTATAEADLKTAKAAYDAACKKAGNAKNALEAAKTADPTGDHSDLEDAFDAANKELEEADKALKALQNNG